MYKIKEMGYIKHFMQCADCIDVKLDYNEDLNDSNVIKIFPKGYDNFVDYRDAVYHSRSFKDIKCDECKLNIYIKHWMDKDD